MEGAVELFLNKRKADGFNSGRGIVCPLTEKGQRSLHKWKEEWGVPHQKEPSSLQQFKGQ